MTMKITVGKFKQLVRESLSFDDIAPRLDRSPRGYDDDYNTSSTGKARILSTLQEIETLIVEYIIDKAPNDAEPTLEASLNARAQTLGWKEPKKDIQRIISLAAWANSSCLAANADRMVCVASMRERKNVT